jgi:hypothetical protein
MLIGINVYANVTLFAWGGELFMWMLLDSFSCLIDENIKWNNCLCESFAWGGEWFMWMLHHCFACLTHENIEWNNCLCECYNTKRYDCLSECYIICMSWRIGLCKCYIIVLSAWYMKILSGIIVYVNVTSFSWVG